MSEVFNEASQDNLQPLVDYYRKRTSDVEYEFLQYQIAASKEIEQLRQQLASQAESKEAVPETKPKR